MEPMPSGVPANQTEDSPQRRKDAKVGDARSLCAFASLRFIQPSDEPHTQRRNRRPAVLHGRHHKRPDSRKWIAIWPVLSARLRIRAMEPMPSGEMGGWDEGTLHSRNSQNNLTQKVAPTARAGALPEPAGDGLFPDLSTMSKITPGDI